MIDSNLYRDFLLSHIPGARRAGGNKEVLIRCRYCPDSKDMKQAHMYLSIPQGKDEVPYYYCQKCRAKGIVTYKKLMEWGIYDDTIAIELISHMKGISINPYNSKYFDREVYILYNNYITQDSLSEKKLRYLNNRLGLNLTFKDCMDMKIALNLNDVLKSNRIEKFTRSDAIINQLDANFLGFISLDNAFINMRRLCKEGKLYSSIDKRYINYSIFGKFDNSERFYTIPKNIDLSINRRIALHIAEGPMDILSVYYNLRGQSDDIYTCIGGNNYKGILRKFILGMRLPYLELHFYPDNDKFGSNYVMMDLMEFCRPFNYPIYVHRNVMPEEKDFGVSLNKIEERIERLM